MASKELANKGWSICSLVTGILGLVLLLVPYFAIVFNILAIVGYCKCPRSGMSKAGLTLGIIGCVINGISLLFLLGFLILASALI